MASQVLATVHLPYTTGLPEDEAVNTFAFDNTAFTTPTTQIADLLVQFYKGSPGTNTVSGYISEVCDRTTGAARVDLAEIVDAGPTVDIGPVYYSQSFTLDPASLGGSGWPLPLEVAMVASFWNTTNGSVTIRRRRGRVYIGPLDVNCIDSTGDYPLAADTFVEDVAAACEALATATAANDTNWSVWSRRDGALYHVDTGFVDNEFDTQRRRGAQATSRENWSII